MPNYTPMSYQSGDFLSLEKMNQLQSNVQYLYENQPDVKYTFSSVTRSSGVKILAGSLVLPASPTTDNTFGNVYFGDFFTPGCFPIINATPMVSVRKRVSVAVTGLTRLEAGHDGCRLTVCQFETVRKNVITDALRVNYIAVGY